MSTGPDTVLAVDFGTANSYYCNCPLETAIPSPIRFSQARDGIATVVLYRRDDEPLVGQEAIDEWADAPPEERAGFELQTHFKPEVGTRPEARKSAIDFLHTVLDRWSRGNVDIRPLDKRVYFGVPSGATSEYCQAIKSIAAEAGYGEVRTIEEPVGALLAHLRASDLSPAEATQGILVVDFGGGTCDFAYMTRLQVRHSWGDPKLGGRLFDDLFYQWFEEQNPERAKELEQSGVTPYVRWVLCPEAKERFSATMERDRTETFRRSFEGYGRISDVTWDQFVERAAHYRPSGAVREFMASGSGSVDGNPDDPIDLLGWFSAALRAGLEDHNITPEQVSRVILVGGSSAWPFVTDAVKSALHLGDEQLFRSDRPYAAVAEGAAMLPALQQRLEETKDALRGGLDGFREDELRPLIELRINDTVGRIVKTVAHELMDSRLRPLLEKYQASGGKLKDLKSRMLEAAGEYESRLHEVIEAETAPLRDSLPLEIAECVSGWFHRHDLALDPNDNHVATPSVSGVGGDAGSQAVPMSAIDEAVNSAILGPLGLIVTGISSTIVASICGGTGTALVMAGPIGLVIGAVIGIVVTIAALIGMQEAAREMAEEIDFPAWAIGMVLTDSQIKKVSVDGRKKLAEHLQVELAKKLAEPCERIEQEVALQVQREIEALDALCRL